MKKSTAILFTALFLLICLVPSVGMLLCGPSGALANEIPARAPAPLEDGKPNMEYLSGLTEYAADSFFLRRELITGYAKLQALFGQSANEDVVLGREGWLFYGEELADYAGTEPLTERELFAIAKNLSLIQEYVEGMGAEFLFSVAPNKSSLYPQYMPDWPTAETERNAQRLMVELEKQGVAFADLFEAFGEEEETLYFAHDSHWTSRGAALAADTLLEALGRENIYFEGDFSTPEPHAGDLFGMLYPAAEDGERNAPPVGLDFQEPEGIRPDSVMIETTGSGEGSLLMFRDSFGELLYPYLADGFESALFSRQAAYRLAEMLNEETDVVIIELVERNLRWLMEQPSVFPAPERTETIEEAEEGEASLSVLTSGAPEGCFMVEGELSGEPAADSPVYLMQNGRLYEALLSGESAFTACLPEEAAEACTMFWREAGGWRQCEIVLP